MLSTRLAYLLLEGVLLWIGNMIGTALTASSQTSQSEASSGSEFFVSPCPKCDLQFALGTLEEVPKILGHFPDGPITVLKEDRYDAGTFYYASANVIMRFVPGQPVEQFLGNTSQPKLEYRYTAGNSAKAEFAEISDFVQRSRTKMLIADFKNSCIREYDSDKNYVGELVGICRTNSKARYSLTEGDVLPAMSYFLNSPIAITLLETQKSLLIIDYAPNNRVIIKFDFQNHTVELLGPGIIGFISQPYGMIANANETLLYVSHSNGLSQIDIRSLRVTEVVRNGDYDIYLTFISRSLYSYYGLQASSITGLKWLIPDKLLLTIGTNSSEAMMFVNVIDNEVDFACEGFILNRRTITGPLGTCQVNLPSAVAISGDGTLYVASLTGKYIPRRVQPDARSSIHKINTKISQCHLDLPQGIETIEVPDRRFYQYDTIEVQCIRGMVLNATRRNRQCVKNSMWDEPLPNCIKVSSADDINVISPLIGQLSGGARITVIGLIPAGLQIYINDSVNGHHSELVPTYIEEKQLSFQMPKHNFPGKVELRIKLSDEITATYDFVYALDPVVNHTISSATTVSWSIPVVFDVVNINSSYNYYLRINGSSSEHPCSKNGTNVLCYPGFLGENKAGDGILPVTLDFELFSDGVFVHNSNNTKLSIYPDPTIDEYPVEVEIGTRLKLTGLPDVGEGNMFYDVTVYTLHDEMTKCENVKIKRMELTCQLSNKLRPGLGFVNVRLGNVSVSHSNVTLLPQESPGVSRQTVHTELIIGLVIGLFFASLTGIILWRVCRYTAAKRKSKTIRYSEQVDDWSSNINPDLKFRLNSVLVSPESLKVENHLIGEGNFGNIFLGKFNDGNEAITVAVKTLKELQVTLPIIERFLEEALILKDFEHVNVLTTLGVCVTFLEKPQVVLPYMENGDLKSLLQKIHMNFTLGDLMHFAKQISCGMEYLADNKFLHRDLAARNCLVSNKYIVKIADFGLSRDVYIKDYYRREEGSGTPLPVKWLALECLYPDGVFTTKSDVWSFGILMWELVTRGAQPYSTVNVWDVRDYLEDGRRLIRPAYCPPAIYDLMTRCWLVDPADRPTFTYLYDFLSRLLEEAGACSSENSYSFIRDYTKDISHDYVNQQPDITTIVESSVETEL